jgi:hypothetical protein
LDPWTGNDEDPLDPRPGSERFVRAAWRHLKAVVQAAWSANWWN